MKPPLVAAGWKGWNSPTAADDSTKCVLHSPCGRFVRDWANAAIGRQAASAPDLARMADPIRPRPYSCSPLFLIQRGCKFIVNGECRNSRNGSGSSLEAKNKERHPFQAISRPTSCPASPTLQRDASIQFLSLRIAHHALAFPLSLSVIKEVDRLSRKLTQGMICSGRGHLRASPRLPLRGAGTNSSVAMTRILVQDRGPS